MPASSATCRPARATASRGVPVQQAPLLKTGLPVEVEGENGAVTTEKVTFVSPSVDDTTQTVLVKAAVTKLKNLRTDQFVRTNGWWTESLARQDNQLFLSSGYWGVQTVDLH